jgi:hypothetical protein
MLDVRAFLAFRQFPALAEGGQDANSNWHPDCQPADTQAAAK